VHCMSKLTYLSKKKKFPFQLTFNRCENNGMSTQQGPEQWLLLMTTPAIDNVLCYYTNTTGRLSEKAADTEIAKAAKPQRPSWQQKCLFVVVHYNYYVVCKSCLLPVFTCLNTSHWSIVNECSIRVFHMYTTRLICMVAAQHIAKGKVLRTSTKYVQKCYSIHDSVQLGQVRI